jgi:aminopeptidase
MQDPRLEKLAAVLVSHSCQLTKKDTVLIEAFDVPEAMTIALIKAVQAKGATPMVNVRQSQVTRALMNGMTEKTAKTNGKVAMQQTKLADAYIAVRGANNTAELADVAPEKMKTYAKDWGHPVLLQRVNYTRWVVLRYPSPSMAQDAQMSTEAFEDFFFEVCTMDYAKMARACEPLVELMEKTNRVHIIGPGTDLKFSIKDIAAIPCFGERNIPDGECFTAPVKTSVEGQITFNAPTIESGVTHENVCLKFKKGKIIEATSSNSEKLNDTLNRDAGARYIGEFAIGFNPYITKPMRDILFDEKIAGSFHFTPGQAYEIADNGNRSEVHWDMVCIQRPDFGGGEIYFDNKLIRKDGHFVLPQLEGLNPDNLKGS